MLYCKLMYCAFFFLFPFVVNRWFYHKESSNGIEMVQNTQSKVKNLENKGVLKYMKLGIVG